MTDGSKPDSKKPARLRAIGFGLGPPKPGGWSVSSQGGSDLSSQGDKTLATREASRGAGDAEQTKAGASLHGAGQQFVTRLQLLLTYRREIGTVAEATSFANSMSILVLLSEMAEASRNRSEPDALANCSVDLFVEHEDGREDRLSVTGPIYEHHHVEAIEDRVKYNDAALRLLFETSVQELVNGYERLIGDIARSYITENAESVARDQSLTYREILEFGSLDEVKRAVVEAQVTDLIRNNDTVGQLKWLREQMKVDVCSQFPDFKAFRGLELRRHVIVHAGGIATSEYLRRLGKLGETESATEATPLVLSAAYIERSWDVVYALGVVTVHLACVGRARRLEDAEQEASADGVLNQAAFWAIKQRRYGAAEMILEYAHKRRLSKTTDELTVLVNLAQTYKWQGRDKDCKDLLSAYDWEAASDRFRLCVAVLMDEDGEQYLARAVKSGDITLDDLYEWPVFSKFRHLDEFRAVVERVFGADAKPVVEKFPALLLNFSHEDTLRELFEHLSEPRKKAKEKDAPVDSGKKDTVH